jgi:elongation factor 1-beta
MGIAGVTIRTMPESPEINLEVLKKRIEDLIIKENGKIIEQTEEPVAFGLKAIITRFTWDETKDSDTICEKVLKIENVNSSQVTDVRRMMQ